nr:MAG TPA: hypothetical protein [Caudoviricetes sp.]
MPIQSRVCLSRGSSESNSSLTKASAAWAPSMGMLYRSAARSVRFFFAFAICINSFCGWHPRPCPAGCRVVSTLATGSSSGGLCPEIKIGQNILPILRCVRQGITRTIVPAKHFTKVIHPARNACACILFENFHRSDLLKHLHAGHGVVSRRAHITVRKSNDRVPCAIVVDLQCIAMRLGFSAVNPLARPAASLPAKPVVTPCGYNITNAVRISYFPGAPAPSCDLVNVHHPLALLSSLKCRAHSAAEVGEADRVLQLLLTHVSGLKLDDELDRPPQTLHRLAVQNGPALCVGLCGVVPLQGAFAACNEVGRNVNRKCVHGFVLLFTCVC